VTPPPPPPVSETSNAVHGVYRAISQTTHVHGAGDPFSERFPPCWLDLKECHGKWIRFWAQNYYISHYGRAFLYLGLACWILFLPDVLQLEPFQTSLAGISRTWRPWNCFS